MYVLLSNGEIGGMVPYQGGCCTGYLFHMQQPQLFNWGIWGGRVRVGRVLALGRR